MEIKTKFTINQQVTFSHCNEKLTGTITGIEIKAWYYSSHKTKSVFIDYWIDHNIRISEEQIITDGN